MTKQDAIIELTGNKFYADFAALAAAQVIEMGAVQELYALATERVEILPTAKKRTVVWRSGYIVEYIYFNHRELFEPFREQFMSDFTSCTNQSSMRSFSKMMADILKYHLPTAEQQETIAVCAAEWVVNPKVKVAVKVWSMSILQTLRPNIEWIEEMWEDVETMLTNNATPAIAVRLKRGWK